MAARSRSIAGSASTLSSPFDCRVLTGRQWPRQHHERELALGQTARSASILVVDDEPDVADLFRQRLRREARQGTYVMHFATSGPEALDRLAEEIQPTLVAVVSDINMPGMDGLELLGEIKQRRPDLPAMMVTADGDAFEFITKPVDFDRLKEQIRQLPAA